MKGGQNSPRRREKRPRPAAPLFPGAARVEACRVIWQEDHTPALFLRTLTHAGRAALHRLPEGVGVTFQPQASGQGFRAFFSSPDGAQRLDLTERAYMGLLEGLACLLEARQTVGGFSPSADLPPAGHSLKCVSVIEEASGPALYFGTTSPDFRAHVYRVGKDTRVTLEAPHPLPPEVDSKGRAAMLKGRVILTSPTGRACLTVPTVSTARALLEALPTVYGEGKKGAA